MAVKEDESAQQPQKCALIICYPKKGEKIWNIAKRYGSTCKAIADENGISGDEIEEDICLCGLSLGGVLALNYAIEHPGKIKVLVLIARQPASRYSR